MVPLLSGDDSAHVGSDGGQESTGMSVSEGQPLHAALAAEFGRVRELEAALVAELGELELGQTDVVSAAPVSRIFAI